VAAIDLIERKLGLAAGQRVMEFPSVKDTATDRGAEAFESPPLVEKDDRHL